MSNDIDPRLEAVRRQRDYAEAEVHRLLGVVGELRADLPEVECPACGATIRARLADQPRRLPFDGVRDAEREAYEAWCAGDHL